MSKKAKELVVWCPCESGALFKTSLVNPDGAPVLFWLTEDEKIVFKGYCSHCGKDFYFDYPIMQLLFDCPTDRRVN